MTHGARAALGRDVGDETAGTLSHFHESLLFEIAVGLHDRRGIHPQARRQRAHRRQRIARGQFTSATATRTRSAICAYSGVGRRGSRRSKINAVATFRQELVYRDSGTVTTETLLCQVSKVMRLTCPNVRPCYWFCRAPEGRC